MPATDTPGTATATATGAPAAGVTAAGTSTSPALAATGTDSMLLTTIGFGLIAGGVGVMYLSRMSGGPKPAPAAPLEEPMVPAPRQGRCASAEQEARRRRPSPSPSGRQVR